MLYGHTCLSSVNGRGEELMYFEKIATIDSQEPLSRAELARAEHEKGRELLAELLLENFGLTEYEIEIGEHGKPFLADGLPYHFSISHSAGIVACVVSTNEVGIDIEKRLSMSESKIRSFSARFFTPEEQSYLEENDFLYEVFLLIWTRKEALSKYYGTPFMDNANKNALSHPSIISIAEDDYIYSVMIKN